ncbi:MAG: ROK family protein, partial [Bacteroidota bacterium]
MNSYIGSNGTFELMRNLNLEKIYRLILLNQPVSRVQLSKLSGLNKMTVTNCVDFLLEKGVVHELGVTGTRGRPATMLSINGDSGVLVGIEMNIPSIRVIVTNLVGTILENIILPDTGPNPEAFIQQVSVTIKMLREQYKLRKLGVVGVGIAFSGHYNQQTGIIELMSNRQTWNKFSVQEELQKCNLGVPIFIQSTMQAGAMGEIHFGNA